MTNSEIDAAVLAALKNAIEASAPCPSNNDLLAAAELKFPRVTTTPARAFGGRRFEDDPRLRMSRV